MEKTLFTVLGFLCSLLQTSWADLTQVSQLPQFPLKVAINNTGFDKWPEIRVLRACRHVESIGSHVRFNCGGGQLNQTNNWVEIYRQGTEADLVVTCSAPYPVAISTNIIAKVLHS